MAGTGVRLFLSGDTAYAADINTYLMDQVVARFATTAARDAAFGDGIPVSQGGSGKPALSEGRICYIDNLNLIQYYDGAAWQDSEQFTVGDGTITTAKLANNSVTSDKIAPGTVIAADIAAGTVTATELADGAVTSAKILDGTIVNADINASAAIALSKLASGTSAQVVIANSSGVPTYTTLSGDVTVSNTGVTAIQPNSVALGTDTTGNYMTDVSAGTGIAVTHTPAEGSTATIALADATIDTKTANYTLQLTDKNKFIEMNIASSANTVSVPTDASVDFPVGSQINITQYGTGKTQVVAVTPGTTSIRSTPGSYLRAQYSSATLIKRAANEWYLIGDLSAS